MRIAVTGAAPGIGAGIVALLKSQGHEVVGFNICRPDNFDEWIYVDLSQIDDTTRSAEGASGLFDALVNNAGLPPRPVLAFMICQQSNWIEGVDIVIDGGVSAMIDCEERNRMRLSGSLGSESTS